MVLERLLHLQTNRSRSLHGVHSLSGYWTSYLGFGGVRWEGWRCVLL